MASSIQKVSVQVAVDKQAWEDSLEQLSGPELRRQVARVRRELTSATRNVGFDRGGLSESQQRSAQKNLERLRESDLLTQNDERRLELAIQIGEAERRIVELRRSATGSAASNSALAEAESRLQTLQDSFLGGGTTGFEIDLSSFDTAANRMQQIVESEREAAEVAEEAARERASLERLFERQRRQRVRDAERQAQRRLASDQQLSRQRERALYRAYSDEQRLEAQAIRRRQAAADSLAKQRERALFKEFQQREREEQRAAAQAARVAARGGDAGGANESGFQDAGRRNQAAAQQLIYAFEDAASSTDGLRGALRGASNNISQFAQIFFQGSPLALGLATFGTVAAQLALTIWNSYDATEEAVEVEDELAKARERTSDISEQLLSRIRDANNEFNNLFGSRGRTAATGALGEEGQRRRQVVAEDLAIRDLEASAASGDRGVADLREEEEALRQRVRDIQRFIELNRADPDASNQEIRDRLEQRRNLGRTLGFEENGWQGFDMDAVRAELRETQEAGREVEGQRIEAETEAGATRRRALVAREEQDRINEIADRFAELGDAFREAGEESDDLTSATLLYDEALDALESGSLDRFRDTLTQVEQELDFASDGLEDAQARAQATRDQELFDDLTGVTAAAEQEDRVNSFLRAFFAGNDDADASSAAAAAARAFGIDLSTQRPLDSRAAVGVSDLRDSGSELTRLLSGDDGSRGIVEVGKEQVELLKTIAKLAEEQALGLAD